MGGGQRGGIIPGLGQPGFLNLTRLLIFSAFYHDNCVLNFFRDPDSYMTVYKTIHGIFTLSF